MMAEQPVSISFTEEMKGFYTPDVEDPKEGREQGERDGRAIMFHLTISIPDVDFFVNDPREQGTAVGYIESETLGGRFDVVNGVFRCFEDAEVPHEDVKHMRYQLAFNDADGKPMTLSGHKEVRDDGLRNIWRDTSTLYFQLLEGHVDIDADAKVLGAGVLRILKKDFAKQMTTFKTTGPSFWKRAAGMEKFVKLFAGTLWSIYISDVRRSEPHIWDERDIPLYSLEGVKDAEISTHFVPTDDKLTLSMLRFKRKPSKDVVILLHGLSTSTDMFVMPEHYNIVNYLHDNGFTDVWSFDWRGSMRHNYDLFPNTHNMDDVALYDHPAALRTLRKVLREERGDDFRIHVICHCVGSITFHMTMFAGLAGDIASVISNSVSLTPQVTRWGHVKLRFAPGLILYLLRFPNLNPRWATLPGPGIPQGKILAKLVSATHRECDVPACAMLSFMWGDGHPAVYQHENMLDVTHNRVGDLFGAVSVNYYRHMGRCVRRGHCVKFDPKDPRYDALPNDYFDYTKNVEIPILYISGDHNNVFHSSNKATFDILNRLKPDNKFEFKWMPGYGHQDTFMGKNVAKDVFPTFLDFLKRHTS